MNDELSERQELSRIILDIVDLRDKSSYKKTYDSVIKTLKNKLANMTLKTRGEDNRATQQE